MKLAGGFILYISTPNLGEMYFLRHSIFLTVSSQKVIKVVMSKQSFFNGGNKHDE